MTKTTRRIFLKRMAATGAAVAVAPSILRAASPNEKLTIAYIGTGGMGGGHVSEFQKLGAACVCFCDTDKNAWGNALKLYPDAKGYTDYREMIDKHAKEFDAVTVGIPDHHHYPATILALRAGKACYTQKPLTHTVWEARQLAIAAKKYKVATQMGNQGHAGEGWRLLYEWVRSGAIGDVKEVHSWTNRPIWPQALSRPAGEDPVPDTLNWDSWIGPAPMRPYKKDTYHNFKWRGWWDFGAGALGDMACHTQDGIFWALDPGHPISVEVLEATEPTLEQFPNKSIIKWEYPAKGDRPGFVSYWHDGNLKPNRPADLEEGRNLPGTGNLFVGTKGTIMIAGDYGDSPRIIPEAKMKEIGKPPKMLERSEGHYKEFFLAAKGDKPIDYPKSNFAYAGPMSESILLGNVALKVGVGKKLIWDGPNLKVTNIPEANKYVNKEYRKGWDFGGANIA
jgi:predicted dehydrogenase